MADQNEVATESAQAAQKFLVGILGALFVILLVCLSCLIRPFVVSYCRALNTTRVQREVLEATIIKTKKPKLKHVWIDKESLHNPTSWKQAKPLCGAVQFTLPEDFFVKQAPVVQSTPNSAPVSSQMPPMDPNQPSLAPPRKRRVLRELITCDPHANLQVGVFIAMPNPNKPAFALRSPAIGSQAHSSHSSNEAINQQQTMSWCLGISHPRFAPEKALSSVSNSPAAAARLPTRTPQPPPYTPISHPSHVYPISSSRPLNLNSTRASTSRSQSTTPAFNNNRPFLRTGGL